MELKNYRHRSSRVGVCPLCGSFQVNHNRANILFCLDCRYSVSPSGKIERMINHPLARRYGYTILPDHPDAPKFKDKVYFEEREEYDDDEEA